MPQLPASMLDWSLSLVMLPSHYFCPGNQLMGRASPILKIQQLEEFLEGHCLCHAQGSQPWGHSQGSIKACEAHNAL